MVSPTASQTDGRGFGPELAPLVFLKSLIFNVPSLSTRHVEGARDCVRVTSDAREFVVT